MKSLKYALLTAMTVIPTFALAAGPVTFETSLPVEHIYAPAGFDTNDNTEVAVTGHLPNLCYKAPKSTVTLVDDKIVVTVKATKNVNAMGFCANVKVPFVEYIKIGVLDKGQHKIAVNEATRWETFSKIFVAEASSNSIDEVVYANVDEVVRVEDSRKVLLKGYSPSDCFELKEIEIKDNGVDTYSILPKMKQIRANCPMKMIPFTYEINVPEKLEADKVLLHVRVMDGRSVNAFFNNKPLLD
jgi:glutaredoxin-related protein